MNEMKQITCISPLRRGLDVIKKLQDAGIYTANRSSTKGSSVNSIEDIEMEVIDVIVPEERAEDIFEFLYKVLDIGKPHHGLIYQTKVRKISNYRLPNEEELHKIQALAKSDKK
jgi:nitrogen regulatory protein PII